MPFPYAISGLSDAIDVSAGVSSSCAVRMSGRVVCWGANLDGKLGDGTETDRYTPVEVLDLTDAVEVSVGELHACARRRGGTVACWGANSMGQLGVVPSGILVKHLRPVQVPGITDATRLAVGSLASCAQRATGGIVCWGGDIFGALIDLLWVVDEAWRAGVTGMDQTGSGMVMPEQQR